MSQGNAPVPMRVVFDSPAARAAKAVEMLEALLARAKCGECTDVLYIAVVNGTYQIGRTMSPMAAIGESAFLHYRLLRQMEKP